MSTKIFIAAIILAAIIGIVQWQVQPNKALEVTIREQLLSQSFPALATVDKQPFKLTNGSYEYSFCQGKGSSEGDCQKPKYQVKGSVVLDRNNIVVKNNGEVSQAATVLSFNSGGTGNYKYLTLLEGSVDEGLHYVASKDLGDRIQIHRIVFEDDAIVLDMNVHGPDDGLCCPSIRTTKAFTFENGKLTEKPSQQEVIEASPSAENGMVLYKSDKYQFSLLVPKTTTIYGCAPEVKEQVSVRVIEDINGVYIAPLYKYKNEKIGETNSCKKISLNLDVLRKNDIDHSLGQIWHIAIAKAANDQEITTFFKSFYEDGCYVGEKKYIGEGTYEIGIGGTGSPVENPGIPQCFINFTAKNWYSPKQMEVAAVVIGQAENFFIGNNVYDFIMADSFRFYE